MTFIHLVHILTSLLMGGVAAAGLAFLIYGVLFWRPKVRCFLCGERATMMLHPSWMNPEGFRTYPAGIGSCDACRAELENGCSGHFGDDDDAA
jgi:hypothetical protein